MPASASYGRDAPTPSSDSRNNHVPIYLKIRRNSIETKSISVVMVVKPKNESKFYKNIDIKVGKCEKKMRVL